MIRRVTTVAAVGGGMVLAAVGTASALTPPTLTAETAECGEATITTGWRDGVTQVDNTVLVVDGPDGVQTAPVGEPVTVTAEDGGADVDVRYRVWGGGERDYDVPALDDQAALVDYVEGGGDPTAPDAPGVAWESLTVEACEGEPDPTEEPTETEEPTTDPTEEESGGQDDGGAWAEYLDGLEPAPEGTHPGQFCADADAYTVLRYSEESAIQCLYDPDSDRHYWVEVLSVDDLVQPPDEESSDGREDGQDDGEEQQAGGGDGGGLPVTGAALAGLVAAAVATVGGGGAAMVVARRRKAAQE